MTGSGPRGALELRGVSLDVGGQVLLPPMTLAVPAGEVVTIMGESGSGKSSLLAFICGTLPPAFSAAGRVLLDGCDVTALPPERRRCGILFQDDLLFPHMSVGGNLGFALSSSIRKAERRERVALALEEAGLPGFAGRDPATLSGGQRARVAVMRVLLAEPKALLLDEPFSKLDASTRQRFRRFVFDHARERRLPTLLVTHDPADAQAAGGRIIRLRPGSADAEARPEPAFAGPCDGNPLVGR